MSAAGLPLLLCYKRMNKIEYKLLIFLDKCKEMYLFSMGLFLPVSHKDLSDSMYTNKQ
jgi:hypothetical protein